MAGQPLKAVTLLLAGGASRRFGALDKAREPLGTKRLIDHALCVAKSLGQTVVISGSDDYGTNLATWPDRRDGPEGPAAALWAFCFQAEYAACLTLPVDAPYLPKTLLEALSDGHTTAVAATRDRLHPVIGWWHKEDVQQAFETVWRQSPTPSERAPSMHQLAAACNARHVDFPDAREFMNINTPADLALAHDQTGA